MKDKKRFFACILTILLLINFLPLNVSAETYDSEKTVKIGYFAMDNFMEGGEDGSFKRGLTYELLCEIATYDHWKVEFVYGEFSDLYKQLAEGKIDILPNVISTEERKEQVLFHDLLLNEEHYCISALASNVNIDEWEKPQLNGKRIATVKDAYEGVLFDKWALENNVSMEKVFCNGFDDAWKLVKDGKADYILNINNTTPGPEFVSLCEVGESGVYFAIAKGREDILSDIDYAMDLIDEVDSFLISNLQQKYLNESLSSYQLSNAEKEWVKNHSVLRIGGLANDAPYAYKNAEGNIVGAYVELTELILNKLAIDSVKVEWSLYQTMDEIRNALKNGTVDMICPEYHSHSEALNNGFAISETVMNISMGMLTLASADVNGIGSVTTGGTRPGLIYVMENFPDADVLPLDSVDQMVKAVAEEKAAGAIAHIYSLQDCIRNNESDYNITPLSIPCYICYAAMEKDSALIMLINRGYHLLSQAERISVEIRSYGSERSRLETARDFFRENMAFVGFAFLMVAVIIFIAVNRAMYAKKLQKSNEAAKKADKAKTTFLFNMSHDIRTPMNAIIGYTKLADLHADNSDIVRNYLEKISQASNHLLSLINDVLDMSRIESGKVVLEEKAESLETVIDELNSIIHADIAAKNISFSESMDINNKFIICDKLRLSRILLNIMSNSIKYTAEGGEIFASLKELPSDIPGHGRYEFCIKDNGMGMSEEFLKTIFEPFTRAQSSTVSKIQGSGLGMSITKQLINIMGGSIDIKSKEGVGTEATVVFDFVLADKPAETENKEFVFDFTGKKILLVEDNEMNREIATDILEDEGFIVDIAEDGNIAVEKVKNSKPGDYDLVLMDVQMPIMDGYEATRQIRAIEDIQLSNIKIIAMTANAFEEDKAVAIEAGMNAHISKPIDVRILKSVLAEYLKH